MHNQKAYLTLVSSGADLRTGQYSFDITSFINQFFGPAYRSKMFKMSVKYFRFKANTAANNDIHFLRLKGFTQLNSWAIAGTSNQPSDILLPIYTDFQPVTGGGTVTETNKALAYSSSDFEWVGQITSNQLTFFATDDDLTTNPGADFSGAMDFSLTLEFEEICDC